MPNLDKLSTRLRACFLTTSRLGLLVVVVMAASVGLLSLPHTRASLPGGFGSNVDVFPEASFQIEPSIAVNPTNSQNLITAYMDNYNGQTCVAYFSYSQGSVWTTSATNPIGQSINGQCSDTLVRFRSDGTAFVVYLVDTGSVSEIRIRSSTNGGSTWSGEQRVGNQGAGFGITCGDHLDKPWLAIDSAYGINGIIYVSFTLYRQSGSDCNTFQWFINLATSTNSGQTWSVTQIASAEAEHSTLQNLCDRNCHVLQGSNIAVAPNEDVLVAWYDSLAPSGTTEGYQIGKLAISFASYSKLAASLLLTATIDNSHYETMKILSELRWRVRGTAYPKIVSGPNPSDVTKYSVYVVFGARTTDNSNTSGDPDDIFFSRSTNSGSS